MMTTSPQDEIAHRLVADAEMAHPTLKAEDNRAFGHTWQCMNCQAINEGYALLCERCGEW
jgi:hypothetical protein